MCDAHQTTNFCKECDSCGYYFDDPMTIDEIISTEYVSCCRCHEPTRITAEDKINWLLQRTYDRETRE